MRYTPTNSDVSDFRERGYWISPKIIADFRI